jgi:hypothetical protein
VMTSDGRLQLGVNQWPDGSPARSSAGQIPAHPDAPVANWRFFAVTYDATRSPAEVKFYFGTADQDASLDTTVAYDRGQLGEDPGPLAVGHFNRRTRPGHTDRMFRGLIDEIRVHGSRLDGAGALTLDQIRALQGLVRQISHSAASFKDGKWQHTHTVGGGELSRLEYVDYK